MMKSPVPLAILLPVLSALFIAIWAGGVGVIFMVLYATDLHEWGVIGLGVILVIGVPVIAAMLGKFDSSSPEGGSH